MPQPTAPPPSPATLPPPNRDPDHRRSFAGKAITGFVVAVIFYLVILPMVVARPSVRASFGPPDSTGRIPLNVDVLAFQPYAISADLTFVKLDLSDHSTTITGARLTPFAAYFPDRFSPLSSASLTAPRHHHYVFYIPKAQWDISTTAPVRATCSTQLSTTSFRAPLFAGTLARWIRKEEWLEHLSSDQTQTVETDVALSGSVAVANPPQ